MFVKGIPHLIVISSLLTACANPNIDRWVELDSNSKPNIEFSTDSYNLRKVVSKRYQLSEGWHEVGEWENGDDSKVVKIRIYSAVFHRSVVMESSVETTEEVVYDISNDAYVEFGDSGRIKTRQGFWEYQAFSLSGIPCFLMQSYWSNQSFGGIDVVRNADPNDRIVGNHILQAYICDAEATSMDEDFLLNFLYGIQLKNAYWPEDRFVNYAKIEELKSNEQPKSWDKDTPENLRY